MITVAAAMSLSFFTLDGLVIESFLPKGMNMKGVTRVGLGSQRLGKGEGQ